MTDKQLKRLYCIGCKCYLTGPDRLDWYCFAHEDMPVLLPCFEHILKKHERTNNHD